MQLEKCIIILKKYDKYIIVILLIQIKIIYIIKVLVFNRLDTSLICIGKIS